MPLLHQHISSRKHHYTTSFQNLYAKMTRCKSSTLNLAMRCKLPCHTPLPYPFYINQCWIAKKKKKKKIANFAKKIFFFWIAKKENFENCFLPFSSAIFACFLPFLTHKSRVSVWHDLLQCSGMTADPRS